MSRDDIDNQLKVVADEFGDMLLMEMRAVLDRTSPTELSMIEDQLRSTSPNSIRDRLALHFLSAVDESRIAAECGFSRDPELVQRLRIKYESTLRSGSPLRRPRSNERD